VHCKDVQRDVPDSALASDMSVVDAVPQGIFTVPGDGCIDFPSLLRDLQGHGYAGWLVAGFCCKVQFIAQDKTD
jgi:inosose dehydratase